MPECRHVNPHTLEPCLVYCIPSFVALIRNRNNCFRMVAVNPTRLDGARMDWSLGVSYLLTAMSLTQRQNEAPVSD